MRLPRHRAGIDALRRRAEQTLHESPAPPPLSPQDLPDLVQELRIHQCELELQNEELRQSQEALVEVRDRYFELFDQAPVACMTVAQDCSVVEANQAARELFGAPLIGQRLSAYLIDSAIRQFHLFWRQVFATGERQSCTLSLSMQGGEAPSSVCLDALAARREGVTPCARVVALDLTEIARARAALTESQGRFRSVFESTGGGVQIVESGGRIVEANDAVCRLLDYDREALERLTVIEVTHPGDREEAARQLERARREAGATIDQERRCLRRDGSIAWAHVTGSWVHDDEGVPLYAVELISDISPRKASEQALRARQAELEAILDTGTDAVVTTRADCSIRSINQRGEQLFGYTSQELVGCGVQMLLSTPDGEEFAARPENPAEAGSLWVDREATALRKSGEPFPIHVSVSEVRLEDDRFFCAFIRDLTQDKRLEARLHRAQRLEAVGTLASGVAHDFNNLLTGVSGCVNLALDSLEPSHPSRLYLDEIQRSIAGGAHTVRQLVGYSRRSQGECEPPGSVELNHVVTRSCGLIEPVLGEGVDLSLDLTVEASWVLGDAFQLEQILLNLASNARDAMPDGGQVRIATCPVKVPRAGAQPLPAGDYIQLVVEDTGIGMDAATQRRIFDPFYTTKPEGLGSGLGLFSSYGIVHAWGGTIEVCSTPGRGTRLEVYLRRTREGEARSVERVTRSHAEVATGETVLLVEDDRLVRLTTRYYLEQAGYRVLEAQRGDDAVAYVQAHPGSVGILLTDVSLPGSHGGRVAAAVRGLERDIAVVFMSAHPREALVDQGQLEISASLLIKPFTREELLVHVRAASANS